MTTVLVCGGRGYGCIVINPPHASEAQRAHAMAERAHLRSTLFRVMKERGISRIVTGGATGADHFAEEWAKLARVSRSVYLADWNQHGKGAGPIRNQEMLDKGQPTLVIAFPGGKGTADMIARARAAGIEVMEPGGPS